VTSSLVNPPVVSKNLNHFSLIENYKSEIFSKFYLIKKRTLKYYKDFSFLKDLTKSKSQKFSDLTFSIGTGP
jgi:hypothetical protein